VHARRVLYKRISGVEAEIELDDLQSEAIDRFGPLPAPARNLFRIGRMRVTAARLGIERLDVATSGGTVTFGETTSVDAAALILAVQRSARTMRFDGPRKLRFSGKFETEDERFTAAEQMLALLSGCAAAATSPPASVTVSRVTRS